MEQQIITVCITGAAGQISYSLIPLILTGQVFKDKKIHLKLLDIAQMENILKGVVMEIVDCAYPLLEKVEFGSDPKILFKDTDIIVFLGGQPRKPGMERKDLLLINGKIFKEQGEAINEVANLSVKCLVVVNPANTNCLLLQQYATKVPKQNFTCLTRLDQNRAQAQLSQACKTDISLIEDVIIWGNHSTTQYPDVRHAKVNGQPVPASLMEYCQTELISRVQKRGGEILDARKNSSVFSAANAVKDHLRDWFYGTGTKIQSMGVYSDGSYNVPIGLIFSFPVVLTGAFNFTIKQGLEISEFSQDKIGITILELLDEAKDVEVVLT